VRYECIARRRNQYPVKLMCKLLEVSRSGFYAWQNRPESQRDRDDRHLLAQIKRIHAASGGVYGTPRITAELREEGYDCGRRRVARLMRQAGLRGCPKRCFRVTTQRDPAHAVADNLLKQNFSASRPNQHWAADITYSAPSLGRRLEDAA
jgi:putative transposase